jgi:membrane-bound metal-dependent hydrolase YbcI (DUF457 family)
MGLYRGNDQRFCNKVSRDIVVICQDNQTLHDVLEFSGISWPTLLVLGLIIFLGSLSHLLLDGITISGIEPFYPVRLSARLAWLEYPKGIIKTGNERIELPLSFLLLVLGYLILVA